jgi:deoxyribonuclease-4
LRIGIHTSIAGSLEKSALKAAELGANTFQIFSASPRMWRASMPATHEINAFRRARERLDLRPLAIHTNYLINLASLDPVIREKSIEGFRGELDRAVAIGAEYLITHPGSYKGQPVEQAIAACVLGMAEAASGCAPTGLMVLIENTAGSGFHIGCRLEELRLIHDLAARETDLKIGYCLDTCHLLAAGYDIATEPGLERSLGEMSRALGMEDVKVIHANDSKMPLGSRTDRHASIGEGHIGAEGFHRILTHSKLRDKAFILETPVEEDGDDRRNIETLKRLAQPRMAPIRSQKLSRRSRASRRSVS